MDLLSLSQTYRLPLRLVLSKSTCAYHTLPPYSSLEKTRECPAMIAGGDTRQECPCPCQQFVTTVSPKAKHFHDEQSTPIFFDSIFWFWLREMNQPPALALPTLRPEEDGDVAKMSLPLSFCLPVTSPATMFPT